MSKQPLPPARSRSRPNAEPSASATASKTDTADGEAAEPQVDSESIGPIAAYPVPATLIPGEDQASFQAIQDYFFETIDPEPRIEYMLVGSVVDQVREIQQLEKTRLVIVRLAVADELADILRRSAEAADLMCDFRPEIVAKQWALGNRAAVADVRRRLAQINMSEDDFLRNGYALALDQIDRVSTLIERTERRRDRVLKTFEQMRALRSLVELRNLQVRRASVAFIEHEISRDGEAANVSGDA